MARRIFKNRQFISLILLGILLSITTIAFTYGSFNSSVLVDTVSKGIVEDTVYVNDLESDYYYYAGLNYTSSSDGRLPTLNDKNLYNDNNLVKTTITYNGSSIDSRYKGYVSLSEAQSKFVYYKYYPVVDGYIEIELIDNPFSYHPNDLAFNGWITDYSGASISYDSTYYTRTVRVPVTYNGDVPNDININMYASWTNATVSYVNNNTSFDSAISSLNDEGMREIETIKYIYEDPSVDGYYKLEVITTTATKNNIFGSPTVSYGTCTNCYDEDANFYNNNRSYSCPAPSFSFLETGTKTNDCNTFYLQDENDVYDPNAIYYEMRNGRFVEADLEPVIIGSEENDLFNENSNMSGYFRKVDISYNQSISGYYDDVGNVLNGVCTNRGGCSYYELINYYKQDGSLELLDPDETYYYLVTRDTNILVMSGNVSSSWGSRSTKPFTLTGTYNEVDYNPIWNVSNTSVISYADMRIENLTINSGSRNSNSNPSNSSNADGVFYGNFNNVKLGRNIKRYNNYVSFISIIGGMNSSGWGGSTEGSSSNPTKYKIEIESGYYNSISLTYGASNSGFSTNTLYTEMYGIYGNDYDRVTENNSNLDIYFCASGSWGGNIHSSNDNLVNALNTIVKSGSFGTGKDDLTTGIYVGGRYGGTHYAPRGAKIEGGYIYNLIGGPLTEETNAKGDLNDTYIYMTGGVVDAITGGAGTSTTYGNRIIGVTGGTVNYAIFGGSNGYDGTRGDGALTGDSYVYVGGNTVIGNEDYINSNSTIWGAEAGSVFGSGNGNTRYDTIGSVDNTNIVINDEAVINRNIYGSGNYGTAGYSGNYSEGSTNIKMLGGIVKGSIFGSGNNSGSGSSNTTFDINIEMLGGNVLDSIYGGSNQEGVLYGSTNLNIINGSVKDIYGGGLGENTYVRSNSNVTIGSDLTNNLLVSGSIYGGSAYGVVNSTSKNNSVSSSNTLVTVNNGNINNVFGGGKGSSDVTPYVAGDVNVVVNGGVISNLYGGNDLNGEPNGEVTVELNNGVITNAYGGGNNTLVSNTNVYQNNATVTNLYGGSNKSGDVEHSNIVVDGGVTETLYGGNNSGGVTSVTDILVNSGNVTSLYGGGAYTDTSDSNIVVKNGEIGTIYGGGREASIITDTNIVVDGGNISYLYGGSNVLGDVPTTYITVNNGTLGEIYGGNNSGGVTSVSNVNLLGGVITSAYGGGAYTNTTTSNVTLDGSSVSNLYGGANEADVTTSNITLRSGSSEYVFGGSNNSGSVSTSNIVSDNPTSLTVTNLYGGNNLGGITGKTNIDLTGGVYTNIYGGGNMTSTDYTDVSVNNITMLGEFFGGGNRALVNHTTNVSFVNSTINGDLFGGGNLGEVLEDTTVYISNSHILSSVYAGGNGNSAIVYGNTTLNIDDNSIIDKHVFGGGNAANTGSEDKNNSLSNVNIAGASISGNVYGGANTAVLYGEVKLNIGSSVVDISLIDSDINITGTVFGGGEANASGDPNYDYSFISVTKGIDIKIDGESHDNFNISGSIFGSGNASSTSGYSYIDISNYGTFNDYKENISIQRADVVTIKNSSIKLEGTTDRTNEYSTTKFSISRVKELKLANDSTLFLENGTNLLEKFNSLKIDSNGREEKASVTISDDGTVSRNVNNRVYMLEGKNLNIATNEAVTTYGEVSGMTFFGMYQLDRNDRVMTAFYDNKYNNGDTVSSGEFYAFTSGSYALGLHNTNHDITKDGFYTNYEDEEQEGVIDVKYIEPTPSDASYYMWVIGETVTTYEFNLTASKYSTLGTYELPLVTSSKANTEFSILGFNYQNLEEGFSLVDKSEIDRVNLEGEADNKMSLVMESANSGFSSGGETTFMTNESTPITGTTSYKAENSTSVSSFIFYLYHSKNLELQRELGTVVISLVAITPIDDLNNEVTRININVTLNTALYNTNDYEAAMTPGEQYGLFASTATNITNKSSLSAYYSLYMESDTDYYKEGYYHTLVSSYVLPKDTKITMIDFASSTEPKYYYYVVSEDDVSKAEEEYNLYGEASYDLSKFIAMGSTSTDNNYNEEENMNIYYDDSMGIIEEEFIFIVDFADTSIDSDKLNNSLLIELRNSDDQVLIGVLGVQIANMNYSLYSDKSAVLDVEGTLDNNQVYLGDTVNLNLITNFIQPMINSIQVIDTTYFNKKPGVKISIYDSNGNMLNNSSILGLYYELNGVSYYPRMDGSVRIPLADRVANLDSNIKINTENTNLASGDYKLNVESFGSYDGIYFGPLASDSVEIPFSIVNSRYGLKVTLPDSSVIIDKETGLTTSNNNALVFHIDYSSNLLNPNIRLSLYRRRYDEVYSTDYEKVNLLDYINNNLTDLGDNNYLLEATPLESMDKFIYLKENLVSGTYKFVFSLYDDDIYIGEVEKYVIIK